MPTIRHPPERTAITSPPTSATTARRRVTITITSTSQARHRAQAGEELAREVDERAAPQPLHEQEREEQDGGDDGAQDVGG